MTQDTAKKKIRSGAAGLPVARPLSMFIGALLALPCAWAVDPGALPTGGAIVAGSGSMASAGNQLTVRQNSDKLITEWQRFDIGSNAGVRFMQPSSSSVALARVLSNDPTQVHGSLSANGQLFLVNPNGVYVAPGASVNVGGLVASTLDIRNDDFLAGRTKFERVAGATGTIANHGSITAAEGGNVVLIGAQVVNAGTIQTPGGTAALGAGDQVTLDFHGDRLLSMTVDRAALAAQAANSGLIVADGGTVLMKAEARDALMGSVVNNSGIIRARSIGMREGVVVLDGGSEGVATHTGAIDVSGLAAGEQGGTAKVLGDKVALLEDAGIDARGNAGGGTVRIGGSYKGEGSERNASATAVGDRVEILADAIGFGKGGEVIVWADGTTRYFGRISARGGATGGDGGFVETSGKDFLEAHGTVDASAAHGAAGTWLLDPRTLTITAATANGSFDGGSPNVFTPTANNATVNVGTINASLNGGTSVTITTGTTGTQVGDITLTGGATVSKTAGGDATLSLLAARHVVLQGKIISSSGKLHVVLNSARGSDGGAVAMEAGAQVITNGGNITIGGGADPTTGYAQGTGTRNNGFSMESGGTSQSTGTLLSAGDGNILINAMGGGTSAGFSMTTSNGYNTIMTTGGDITVNARVTSTSNGINISSGNNTISTRSGDVLLSGEAVTGRGVYIYSSGNNGVTSETGSITLRGTTAGGTDLVLAPSTGKTWIGTHGGATTGHDLTYTGTAGGAITLEGDTMDLGAGLQIAGSGALKIQPRSASTSIDIGDVTDGSGTLALNAARLALIKEGFSSVTIGRAGGTGAINVGAASFSDDLVLRGGPISQSGTLVVGGTTTLDAGANDVTLTNGGNDFTGAVSVKARNASLVDANALTLGESQLSGSLELTAGGRIGQTGALTVAGALTAVSALAGAGDATFNNSGAAATQLGDIRVGNDFTLVTATGDGNITQSGSSHLEIGRNLNVSGGGTLTAPAATNAIGGGDNSAGAGVIQVGRVGMIDLSAVDIGEGAGNLTTGAGQTLNVQSLATGYNVAAAGAGSNAVNLSLANNVGGTITVRTGAQATVAASGAAVATGISQNGATINLGGAASFSTATSPANAGGAAGNIVLDGAANQFAGALSLNGNQVTVNAQGGLQLGSVNAGTFDLTATGPLTQAAAITAGTMNASVGANDVVLRNASNSIGTLSLGSARNVEVTNSGALELGASSAAILQVHAGGAITQSGALTTQGLALFNAGSADITLAHTDNNFGTLPGSTLNASGNNVALRNSGAMLLGGVNAAGNLTVTAGGQVAQSGALTVGGDLSVTTTHAAGNVTINNGGATATQLGDSLVGGNFTVTASGKSVTQADGTVIAAAGDFTVDAASGTMQSDNVVGGADNSQPGTTVIKQVGVINLGNIDAAGNLSVSSLASARSFSGPAIGGSAVSLTNAGNNIGGRISVTTQAPTLTAAGAAVATGIVQNAGTTINVAGNASFSAGGGAVTLTNAGNNFGGDLSATAGQVRLANAAIGANLAVNQTVAAALSDLTIGGSASVSGTGPTALSGSLHSGGDFTVGAGGTGAVALEGDTTILADGTGRVSFGAMDGGGHALDIEAHDVALGGNWTGNGAYSLRANKAASTVGLAGGTGTFNLSAQELGYIANAAATNVTIGRADGSGDMTINAFSFDDALRLQGGNVTLGAGSYAFERGVAIASNGNLRTASGATVNVGTVGGTVALSATGNVVFNSGAATAINTAGGEVVIASRSNGSAQGYVDLRNTTIASGGGNVTVGGGAADASGDAIGTTVNGVRLGNTTIDSNGGRILINGQSDSVAGVGMGISSASTLSAGAGDIMINGRSNSAAGIAMQSGAVSGGQTLRTTTGNIILSGVSASSDGMRVGSTSANTAIAIETAGGDIRLTGVNGGGTGHGLNIGAGAITLTAASGGAIALDGNATGEGNGVRLLATNATDTLINTEGGTISINGLANTAAGIAMQTGGQTLRTTTGDIVLTGTSVSGDGMRLGSTAANTVVRLETTGGDIRLAGVNGGGEGNGLNIGAGAVTLSTTSGGAIAMDGTAAAEGHGVRLLSSTSANTLVTTEGGTISIDGRSVAGYGVYLGPSTTQTGTRTALATQGGDVVVNGTSRTGYGISFAASGTPESRGAASIETRSGNIALTGISESNTGFRNDTSSSGDTIIATVDGNISIIGITGSGTSVSIDPQTSNGNDGSAKILATGRGNVSIAGDRIVFDGSRILLDGAGGTLTLQPTSAGSTVGFGSGTSGTMKFLDADLAGIGDGFSTIYVGNTRAGTVQIGETQPKANVVAVQSPVPLVPDYSPEEVAQQTVRASTVAHAVVPPLALNALQLVQDGAVRDGQSIRIGDGKGCSRAMSGAAVQCAAKSRAPARTTTRGGRK